MVLEIQVMAWDNHKNVAGLNRLMGFQHSLLITGSPTTIYIYVVYMLQFCTCYNLNNPKIHVITCIKVTCTCYNMYKILLRNE